MIELTLVAAIVIGALLITARRIIRAFARPEDASAVGCGCSCDQCVCGSSSCGSERFEKSDQSRQFGGFGTRRADNTTGGSGDA